MSYGGASPIIDYGVINFVRNRREAKADFLRVGHTVPVHHLLRFLTKQWKLPDPGIIVQVTGSAQGFDLPPNLVTPITEGIVEAASVAEAWIITGGFDAGVMSLVGSAVARWKHKCDNTPLLGVGSWRGVQNKEMLENACGNRVSYHSAGKNTSRAAGLEPNHTQFLLVDNGQEGDKTFGAELTVLENLQKELRNQYAAPTVLLVIQGGPGTLDTMLRAQRQGIVTVVAADSGQFASAMANYMRTNEVDPDWKKQTRSFEEIKSINEEWSTKDEREGTSTAAKPSRSRQPAAAATASQRPRKLPRARKQPTSTASSHTRAPPHTHSLSLSLSLRTRRHLRRQVAPRLPLLPPRQGQHRRGRPQRRPSAVGAREPLAVCGDLEPFGPPGGRALRDPHMARQSQRHPA